jgi:hypothetical protein
LGESTPTFGETRPTSSVLFLLFTLPIVETTEIEKEIGGNGLPFWEHCFDTEEGMLPSTENSGQ